MSDMAPAGYEHITIETDGGVAWVTMNRPKRRNALSFEHMQELLAGFTAIGRRDDVAAVILRGNGPVFCSGHDLSEMVGQETTFYRHLFDLCTRLMECMQAIPQPVIGQVHGVATAAGCQLAATCDLVVAAEDARFATPGVKIGLFCSTPMVAISRAMHPKKAMEMLLTGDFISAAEAHQAGLVNQVVPLEELEGATRALADKICAASPLIVALGKRTFYQQIHMAQADAYVYTKEVMTFNATLADSQEGISAFLEKRPPQWSGR